MAAIPEKTAWKIGMRACTTVPTSWRAGISRAVRACRRGCSSGTIMASSSVMIGPRTANSSEMIGTRAWMTGMRAAASCSMIGASRPASCVMTGGQLSQQRGQ